MSGCPSDRSFILGRIQRPRDKVACEAEEAACSKDKPSRPACMTEAENRDPKSAPIAPWCASLQRTIQDTWHLGPCEQSSDKLTTARTETVDPLLSPLLRIGLGTRFFTDSIIQDPAGAT